MKKETTTKKLIACFCAIALIVSSLAIDGKSASADDGTWQITNTAISILPTNGEYGMQNLTFTAYQGSQASAYAYAAFINEIKNDNLVKAANNWVWGIVAGGNNLNFDTVWSTSTGNVVFEPGNTYTIYVCAYDVADAGKNPEDVTPLDTISTTVIVEEIVQETKTAAAVENVVNKESENQN